MPILNVIKYDGPSDVLLWRHPKDCFNTGTKLIVGPSQEAVFIKSGKIFDILGPGFHTLSTGNIPLLSTFAHLPYGGRTPFTSEIVFINQLHILDIKWGTLTPIQLTDPTYHIMIPVRAFGHYGIKVRDSMVFIEKMAGAASEFKTADLISYFRGIMGSHIVDAIANYLVKKRVTFGELNAHISEMSVEIEQVIAPHLANYGVSLVAFNVNSLNVPEDDPSVIRLHKVLDKKNEMNIMDFDYRQERSFDVASQAASQMGGLGGELAGVGVGAAMGAAVADIVKSTLGNAASAPLKCSVCGKAVGTGCLFCPSCGAQMGRTTLATCPKCGTAVSAGMAFCGKCGAKLTRT